MIIYIFYYVDNVHMRTSERVTNVRAIIAANCISCDDNDNVDEDVCCVYVLSKGNAFIRLQVLLLCYRM